MIRLRPYKLNDADYILNWLESCDKLTFTKWCADKFTYPLDKNQLDQYYHNYENDNNGWIMTALDEEGIPVGHFLMRKADYHNENIHLGFIIVDPKLRGRGYGKEMVSLAAKYAFEILKVNRVTLCVFENNFSAHSCYKAAGFVDEKHIENIFPYEDDKWGLYDMAIVK